MARDSETGPSQSEWGLDRYVRTFSFLAPVTQKKLTLVNQAQGKLLHLVFVLFLPARPPWWCGGGDSGRPQPDPLARWPAPVIAVRRARAAGGLRDRRDRPGRRDPACTFRPLRDRAVTA